MQDSRQETGWRWLLRLYPSVWRERYEEEFLALLENLPLSWERVFDVIGAAIDAHLHPELHIIPGGYRMNRWLYRIAGLGAVLSIVIVGLAVLTAGDILEENTEFLLIMAPLTFLPGVVALHSLYQRQAPRLSTITFMIGIIGTGFTLIFIFVGMSSLAPEVGTLVTPLTSLLSTVILLPGVWLILVAYIGWRTKVLPWLLAIPSVVSGVTWLIFIGSTLFFPSMIILPQSPAQTFFNFIILLWLVSYTIWTVGLGIWLIRWLPPADGATRTQIAVSA